jgi:hypothetical protein
VTNLRSDVYTDMNDNLIPDMVTVYRTLAAPPTARIDIAFSQTNGSIITQLGLPLVVAGLPTAAGMCEYLQSADFNSDGRPDLIQKGSGLAQFFFGHGANGASSAHSWPAR